MSFAPRVPATKAGRELLHMLITDVRSDLSAERHCQLVFLIEQEAIAQEHERSIDACAKLIIADRAARTP